MASPFILSTLRPLTVACSRSAACISSKRLLQPPLSQAYSSSAESLPRVAQPGLWHSIVPKFLRSSPMAGDSLSKERSIRKDWNPATFYIVIFLLIGSNAIQLIALRKDFTNYSRQADAKIGLLKEVIQRVQAGEEVDVERLLGSGDEKQEREWEEVLKEIQNEDWTPREKTKGRKGKKGGSVSGTSEPERTSYAATAEAGDTLGKAQTLASDDVGDRKTNRVAAFY